MSAQDMIKALMAIGFTEEAIAYGVHAHKSTISRILRGKTNSPRYHLANEIRVIFEKYATMD